MITRDDERLARVASTLGEAIRQAHAGERVRLPVIQAADAAGLVMVMHAQLDAAISERTKEAADNGLVIACSAKCSACCASPLLVSEGEAVAVAAWLGEQPEIRAQFATAYPAWKKAVGTAGEALEQARTDEAREAAARALRKQHVMCAFNRDGLCTIYDARPARCRKVHALDTNAACGPDGDGKVQYFEHRQTEATFEEQEPMRGALHHALRPNSGLELLCSSSSHDQRAAAAQCAVRVRLGQEGEALLREGVSGAGPAARSSDARSTGSAQFRQLVSELGHLKRT